MSVPIITQQVVNASDSPNTGRLKWNQAITDLINDRTNFVRSDGTTPIAGNIDFNGYRGINLSAGVDDNDTATVLQVKDYANKPFNDKQIYVQTYKDSTYVENIYADGTTNLYAIRCGTLQVAVDNIPSDSTTLANAWTINLYGGKHTLDVDTLDKVVNIEGYGNPTINVVSTNIMLANTVVLANKGTTRGCTIRCFQATNNPIVLKLYEGVYKDNIVYAKVDGSYVNDSSIVVETAVVTESDIIATKVMMDSTALNGMVDNCRMSADLDNWENNVDNAVNKVVTNLETIYGLS